MRRFLRFWEDFGFLLMPLGFIYRTGLFFYDIYWSTLGSYRPNIPSIGVGNLTVGGSGKTPLVIYLAGKFLSMGKNPVVMTSGYMRNTRDIKVLVGDRVGKEEEFGDEALLIFRKLKGRVPVIIGRDRIEALKIAESDFKPDLVIFDDIYQYRRLRPHILLLLVHEGTFKRPFLLPAGPLREPLSALKRADAIIYNKKIGGRTIKKKFDGRPFFLIRYRPSGLAGADLKAVSKDYLKAKFHLFSGIAEPLSFERAVRLLGLDWRGHTVFRDHHWYTSEDMERLERKRIKYGADFLLTTEKDMVRLPGPRERVLALKIEVEINEEDEFFRFLLSHL